MPASEDDQDVLSFSCVDDDAREELEQCNMRRARRLEVGSFGGLVAAILVFASGIAFATVVHATWALEVGLLFGIFLVLPVYYRLLRPLTRPLSRNVEAQFTIAVNDTGLEVGARGRTPKRVPLERIVELVADDRLRVALDDGTLVALPCVLPPERLAAVADQLNAALRRRRARVADYRGARIVAEPDDIVETEDPAARRNVS